MTLENAVAKLKLRTAWDQTPAITEDDLTDILGDCQTKDSSGFLPSDAQWTGTYDINLAAQMAWERKAGNAAGCVTFSSDGERNEMDQLIQHCIAMSDTYRRKRSASFGIRDAQGRSLALLPFQIANGPDCGLLR